MAVPPLAETPRVVAFVIDPPATLTPPPEVSPTPIAVPALPPLLTFPSWTAPPFAEDVATPPFPDEATLFVCVRTLIPSPFLFCLLPRAVLPRRAFPYWSLLSCSGITPLRTRGEPRSPN